MPHDIARASFGALLGNAIMDVFKAWVFSPADYQQFRELIPDHTDFPDAYYEWLYVADQ